MKFLVDNALSPRLTDGLRTAGHEARHVADIGLRDASDNEIADEAERTEAVVVTADSDFGTQVSQQRRTRPSVILFRGALSQRSESQLKFLLSNLDAIEQELVKGAVAVLEPGRVRVRRLPVENE